MVAAAMRLFLEIGPGCGQLDHIPWSTLEKNRNQRLTGLIGNRYNVAMLLILTHEKSDFDAIASQLGAHKLFPVGIPLLPRHLNRNVQQFLNLYWDVLPFMRAEEWRRKRVD